MFGQKIREGKMRKPRKKKNQVIPVDLDLLSEEGEEEEDYEEEIERHLAQLGY